MEVANTFNNYFSNVAKNLKIPEKFVTDSFPQSLSRHPTLNAILKYKNHPSMHVIKKNLLNLCQVFIFHMLTKILFLKRFKNQISIKQYKMQTSRLKSQISIKQYKMQTSL